MPRRIRCPRASPAYGRHLGEHFGVLGQLSERLGVDADREDAETDLAAVEEDPVVAGVEMPRMRRTDDAKWLRYVNVWKPDQVRAQHPLEDLLAPREDPQDLRGREGDMQEEADRRAVDALAEHPGHERELIVVDPDQVARGATCAATASANFSLTARYTSHSCE